MQHVIFIVLRRLRMPLIVLVSVYAFSVLGLVLMPGVDDQGNPWRMDFFHAFYFVSFMGSTTGFGELPYPFSGAQRLWVVLTLYLTVFSWLYAIGAVIALMQTPAFRAVVVRNRFARGLRRMREPFFLVCGYGETGRQLIRALADRGLRAVAVDRDEERISRLELEDLAVHVPGLSGDAADATTLLDAGLKHRSCAALVVLTDDADTNLKVAITSKLLNPRLRVICRAETHDAAANIASFGTEHVINPFDTFAAHLARALASPSLHLLHEWLTSPPRARLIEPLFPPRGRWIVCGFGRFGQAVQRELLQAGNTTTVIEQEAARVQALPGAIAARGTEAETLLDADIHSAVGLIAGTDNDANNLSIVMTALELHPDLFVVARQNRSENDDLFRAAGITLITKNSQLIASRILALITTPLTAQFLQLAEQQDKAWADGLVSRMAGITEDRVPHTWAVNINAAEAAAVVAALAHAPVRLQHLGREPEDRKRALPAMALMLKRGDTQLLLPAAEEPLRPGDLILFCGLQAAAHRMTRTLAHPGTLHYVLTGRHPADSWLWARLAGGERAS